MKKLLLILILSAGFMACKHKPASDNSKDLILMNDAMSNSYLSDTGIVSTSSMRSGAVEEAEIAPQPKATAPRRTSTASSNNNSGTVSSGSSSNTGTSQSTQKKGMSKAAKGAIIGGVGGAAAGAVIGKNAKGAIIGGVVGAAGGYIIGRSQDKKDGRVQ